MRLGKGHKKISTASTVECHIKNLLIPGIRKLAVDDIDSERIQTFLNPLIGRFSAKTRLTAALKEDLAETSTGKPSSES